MVGYKAVTANGGPVWPWPGTEDRCFRVGEEITSDSDPGGIWLDVDPDRCYRYAFREGVRLLVVEFDPDDVKNNEGDHRVSFGRVCVRKALLVGELNVPAELPAPSASYTTRFEDWLDERDRARRPLIAKRRVAFARGFALREIVGRVLADTQGRGDVHHDERHWQAVIATGVDLAHRMERSGADVQVAFLFGLLHDVADTYGRKGHGAVAADYARALQAQGVLELEKHRLELLCDALTRHSDGLTSDDPTIGCCWDADRLQLTRVGAEVDDDLISTEQARHSPARAAAARFRDDPPDWEQLLRMAQRAIGSSSPWLDLDRARDPGRTRDEALRHADNRENRERRGRR